MEAAEQQPRLTKAEAWGSDLKVRVMQRHRKEELCPQIVIEQIIYLLASSDIQASAIFVPTLSPPDVHALADSYRIAISVSWGINLNWPLGASFPNLLSES